MNELPENLDADVEGVPRISQPAWWDRTQPIGRNLTRIEAWMYTYQDRLPPKAVIDEASVLVPDHFHRLLLDEQLREAGWEHFNEARDLVYTNPFGTRYFVEYHFYRTPEKPYRLEVMMLQGGFSPLHRALYQPNGRSGVGGLSSLTRYPMPHLSFKPVRREDQTWGKAYGQAVDWLRDKACIHTMTCQSTYGRFGYFLANDAGRQIYIKPRVNLRDDT